MVAVAIPCWPAPVSAITRFLPIRFCGVFVAGLLRRFLYARIFGRGAVFFCIGLQWVVMTLLFEFIFGHYVTGKSWSALFQVFNIMQGDLFILILLVTLISPYLAAKIRGLL